ncbi:MAG: hypothetical protein C7N36_14150 [Bacteroidetes bacterium]|nr:MAG: hypothetical protein C7N36_14150 [Bacteroidota bacterium]
MDICFLPAWFYDIRGEGGGLFFQEQALAMQAVVEKVSVFYPALEPRYWGPEKWSLTQTHQVAVFKYQGFSFPKRITPLLCYYRRQIATSFAIFLQYREGKLPDLIHAHSLWGAYAALVIKEKWGIPFVYTEHLSKWTATDYNLPRRHLHLLKHIQQRADLVTAVSRRLADKINEACQTQTTLVTPNMVDTDFFTLPATKNNKPKVFHLISIGDPWHKKGLDILLEAVGIAQRQTPTQLKLTLVDRIPDRPPLLALIQNTS